MVTGHQIRQARKRAGLSQSALAELVEVSVRSVGGWERDETSPGMVESKLLDILAPHMSDQVPAGAGFHGLSDAELLAEIARRFARSQQNGGPEHGNSSAKKSVTVTKGTSARGSLPPGESHHK